MAAQSFSSGLPVLRESPSRSEWDALSCLGGLSELQISMVVSLEIVRLLTGPADAELADAARSYCLQAWDLVRRAGQVVARYAQVARRVGQRLLPDLRVAVECSEHSSASRLIRQVRGLVSEMEREGRDMQHKYAGLERDMRDLIWRVRLSINYADLSDLSVELPIGSPYSPSSVASKLAATRRFELLLRLRAAGDASDGPLLLLGAECAKHMTEISEAIAQEADSVELVPAAANAGASSLPTADELCAWLGHPEPDVSDDSEAVPRELVCVNLLQELRHADEKIVDSHLFWANMRSSVQRLALMEEHTETLALHATRAARAPLIALCGERLQECAECWSDIERACCRHHCCSEASTAIPSDASPKSASSAVSSGANDDA